MLTHSEVRDFKCDQCSYEGKTFTSLKVHLLTHSEDKPFACNLCDFTCKNKSSLIRHRVTHSEDKPHKCNLCSYSSKYKNVLKKHLETHISDKYKCDECSFSCKWKGDLKDHIKLNHMMAKTLKCLECEFRCRFKSTLDKHLLSHVEGLEDFDEDFDNSDIEDEEVEDEEDEEVEEDEEIEEDEEVEEDEDLISFDHVHLIETKNLEETMPDELENSNSPKSPINYHSTKTKSFLNTENGPQNKRQKLDHQLPKTLPPFENVQNNHELNVPPSDIDYANYEEVTIPKSEPIDW